LNAVGKRAVVIRGDVPIGHASNVMEGIIRQQGHGAAVGGLNGNEGDARISRSRRFDQIRVGDRRIHLNLIHAAEGIGQQGAGLHLPAAVEDEFRRTGNTPGDPGGSKIMDGAADAINDAGREEWNIIPFRLNFIKADACRRGMGVGGGHQNVVFRESRLLVNSSLRFVKDFAWNEAIVADDEGDTAIAIIKHKATRVEFVMYVSSFSILVIAVDRNAQPWGDIAGGRSGAKLFRFRGGLVLADDGAAKGKNQDWQPNTA